MRGEERDNDVIVIVVILLTRWWPLRPCCFLNCGGRYSPIYPGLVPVTSWLISRYIIQSDLCSLLLTCRYFYNIGSCPSLWSSVRINKSLVGPTTSLQFLTWPRFSRLHSLDLSESRAGTETVISLLSLIHRLSGRSCSM